MKIPAIIIIGFFSVFSCRQSAENNNNDVTEGRTPVTVIHPVTGSVTDAILLNATSSFLLKTSVKSSMNGYLQKVNIQLGQKVDRGQELFVVRSKEAEHLGNTINQLDTSYRFSGMIHIKSPASGFITALTCQAGDYVPDNETLATISDASSLVFLLELPYELKPFVAENKSVELTLPDGKKYRGALVSSMPAVDPVSQTQAYVIRVAGISSVPENLVASVKFIRKSKPVAVVLPREAILTNEVQSEFWIMKMIDSVTAVRVPVTKGLENEDKVEIVSPHLSASDLILVTGNYGLPDSAKVILENKD
jgi:multidrug efflux pump subunit AcrA (membrane-fusion protein)